MDRWPSSDESESDESESEVELGFGLGCDDESLSDESSGVSCGGLSVSCRV